MSCGKMESRILSYVDGRLKANETAEMEKHLASCVACRLRVNEFRAVSGLLDELPVIEPSPAFDLRVRALIAAEPVKQSWWASLLPSPRVAFAASMLLLFTIWIGSRPPEHVLDEAEKAQINQDMPVLENYDVLSDFSVLTDLPQQTQPEDENETNQNQQPM